jgi:hypothetical protein
MSLNISDLDNLIKQTKIEINRMMQSLSDSDKKKVDDIVNSVDTKDIKEMEAYLNNQKNA